MPDCAKRSGVLSTMQKQTRKRPESGSKIDFMNKFHLPQTLERAESIPLPALHAPPIYDNDLRASHASTLFPTALASASFGFEVVRVRVQNANWCKY